MSPLAPFGASLCRGPRLVNACPSGRGAEIFVTGARVGYGTAALGKAKHLQDAHPAVERQGNDAADADFFARFLDALAIDADVAFVNHGLRERAALHQPDEEQIAVDPHVYFFSLASSAKA